jgi:hypothetical protein
MLVLNACAALAAALPATLAAAIAVEPATVAAELAALAASSLISPSHTFSGLLTFSAACEILDLKTPAAFAAAFPAVPAAVTAAEPATLARALAVALASPEASSLKLVFKTLPAAWDKPHRNMSDPSRKCNVRPFEGAGNSTIPLRSQSGSILDKACSLTGISLLIRSCFDANLGKNDSH